MSSAGTPPQQTEITVYPEGVDSADGIRRVAGNKKLFDKLLRRIAAELPQNLADMRAAVDAGDMEKVSVLAHTLKGSSANLSLVVIQEKSFALESAAKAADQTSMESALADLETTADAYIAAMANA